MAHQPEHLHPQDEFGPQSSYLSGCQRSVPIVRPRPDCERVLKAYILLMLFLDFLSSLALAWAIMLALGWAHSEVLPAVNPVGFNSVWGIVILFELVLGVRRIINAFLDD